MSVPIVRLASLKHANRFREHVHSLNVDVPCDERVLH